MTQAQPIKAKYRARAGDQAIACELLLNLDGSLWLRPQGMTGWRVAAEDVSIADQAVSSIPHLILRGGAIVEPSAPQMVEAWRKAHAGGKGNRMLSRSQSNLALIFGTILICAGLIWGAYVYAIPAIARPIAFAIPDTITDELGKSTLAQLDQSELAPSSLPQTKKRQIRRLLAELGDAAGINLEFRKMADIANAFALPDGTVVVTDALANKLPPAEVQAVLAHETAHVIERHGMQSIVRASLLPVIIGTVTGDFTILLEASGALTLLLANQGYSRAMESEADEIAVTMLARSGFDPLSLAHGLERLFSSASSPGLPDWLNSHPDTAQRIDDITEAAANLDITALPNASGNRQSQ